MSNDLMGQLLMQQLLRRGQRPSAQGLLAQRLMAQATDTSPTTGVGAVARGLTGALAGMATQHAETSDLAREDASIARIQAHMDTERAASDARLSTLLRQFGMGGTAPAPAAPAQPQMPSAPPAGPVTATPLPSPLGVPQRGEAPPAVSQGIAARAALDRNAPDYIDRLTAINDGVVRQTMPGMAMPRPSAPSAPGPAGGGGPDWRALAIAAATSNDPRVQALGPIAAQFANRDQRPPLSVSPGSTVIDPNSGRPIYTAPDQPETFGEPQRAIVDGQPVLVRYGNRGGRQVVEGVQPAAGFQGNAMEAQALNTLLGPGANPASPEYEAAWLRLYGPQQIRQPDGTVVTMIPPAPANIPPPASMRGAQGAQPAPAAAPEAPQGETMALPGGGSVTTTQTRPRTLSPAEIQLREETETALGNIQGARGSLTQALQLSPQAYAGPLAETRGAAAGATGYDSGTSVATRQFSSIMTEQALTQLRSIFGGSPTEGERAILLQMQASANMSRAEREALIRRALASVERREALTRRRLEEIVGGDYGRAQPGYVAPTGAQAPAAHPASQGGGWSIQPVP